MENYRRTRGRFLFFMLSGVPSSASMQSVKTPALILNMRIEQDPQFTGPAAKLWSVVPESVKKVLLSNVWCGKCGHEVTMTNFTGVVKARDLLLVGKCSECLGDVARLVESA